MRPGPLRLNLGCGEQRPDGWLNLDSSPGARLASHPLLFRVLRALLPQRLLPVASWTGADVRWMELTKPWPLADQSASAVYSSHFLEHLEFDEARLVLRESARVLQPGGLIRIVVPDLESLVESYMKERTENPAEAALHFLANSGFFFTPRPRTWLQYLVYKVRRRHDHHVLHDEGLLRAELERAGFVEIARRSCGDSDIPDIEDVDLPDRFEGALCLEGRKPAGAATGL